jgi:hypothetical protein
MHLRAEEDEKPTATPGEREAQAARADASASSTTTLWAATSAPHDHVPPMSEWIASGHTSHPTSLAPERIHGQPFSARPCAPWRYTTVIAFAFSAGGA